MSANAEQPSADWGATTLHQRIHAAGEYRHASWDHVFLSLELGPPTWLEQSAGSDRVVRRIIQRGSLHVVPLGVDSLWRHESPIEHMQIRIVPPATDGGASPIAPAFDLRDPMLQHMAWALHATLHLPETVDRLAIDGLSSAIMTRLTQLTRLGRLHGVDTTRGLPRAARERVVDYLRANLRSTVRIARLADIAGFSPSHFTALFRHTFGTSPYRYLIRLRVAHAELLLRDTTLPLAEIALRSGFTDQSHMTRHVRRVLGGTPGRIRQA